MSPPQPPPQWTIASPAATAGNSSTFTPPLWAASSGPDILHPTGTAPRPTVYLLDGTGASDDHTQSTWTLRTDVTRFFADKNVNEVMPIGGDSSFYAH